MVEASGEGWWCGLVVEAGGEDMCSMSVRRADGEACI